MNCRETGLSDIHNTPVTRSEIYKCTRALAAEFGFLPRFRFLEKHVRNPVRDVDELSFSSFTDLVVFLFASWVHRRLPDDDAKFLAEHAVSSICELLDHDIDIRKEACHLFDDVCFGPEPVSRSDKSGMDFLGCAAVAIWRRCEDQIFRVSQQVQRRANALETARQLAVQFEPTHSVRSTPPIPTEQWKRASSRLKEI